MEAVEVGGRVEALELRGVETLEPRDVEAFHDVVGGELPGVQRADDRRQGRLAVGTAHRLEQAVVSRYGRVAVPRRRDGYLSRALGDVRHVAGHREQDLVLGTHQAGLEARQWTRVLLPVKYDAIGHVLLHLLWLAARDHHLRER